jgi:8-oxo-dGTP diphosphatase
MTQQKIIVAAFIVRQNKVLLAKRASTKRIGPGKYHLPGGHIEFGEQPTEALRREIKEELQLDILVGSPFFTFAYTIEEVHTVGITYHATLIHPDQKMTVDTHETEQIVWVDRSEVDTYLDHHDHDYLAIAKVYESLAGFAQ